METSVTQSIKQSTAWRAPVSAKEVPAKEVGDADASKDFMEAHEYK